MLVGREAPPPERPLRSPSVLSEKAPEFIPQHQLQPQEPVYDYALASYPHYYST